MEIDNSGSVFRNNFSGKKVLITGNTGFKGTWLTFWLLQLGATVAGYSNEERTKPSMYEELGLSHRIRQFTGDISDFELVKASINEFSPDFIFHLAAQSIVSTGIRFPLETFKTNTLGTVTVLEALRTLRFKGVAVMITSDKCYENDERETGYCETDKMGGKDPYSASKGAAELAISSYLRTFLDEDFQLRIGIGRAGNVIGGGDWNENRIIVDCVKAWQAGNPVELRNPKSTRPWQHVLEPLSGYLQLATHLSNGLIKNGESFNFGPDPGQAFTVEEVVKKLASGWPDCPGIKTTAPSNFSNIIEAKLLSLDVSKALNQLGWHSTLEISDCLTLINEWYLAYKEKKDLSKITSNQICYFESRYGKSIK